MQFARMGVMRPHKVGYQRIELPCKVSTTKARPREKEAAPTKERIKMFALVEGHPNIDVIVLCVIAAAILAVMLRHFHQRQF
jgi:hypothetical protein